jgi:hypothetical protein
MSAPTTRAFEIKKHANLDRVPGKYAQKADQPESNPTPKFKDDLFDRINVEQKNQISEGQHFVRDAQPDFRYVLLMIYYYVAQVYKDIEQKDHALISPASLVAYCLTIVYGHFLVCDYYIRSTKSRHAREFAQDPSRRDFLKLILSLPVPTFLVKFLDILTPSADPRRPLLETIPSFAGFSHHHDFGRTFPVAIFMLAHHRAATTRANDDPEALFARFLHLQISTTVITRIGHYFGALYPATGQATTYDSRLLSATQAMFNPAVQRALGQRFVYAPVYYNTIELPDSDYNPYIFLLNAHEDNIDTMSNFLESIARIVHTDIATSAQLGSRYESLSGIDILSHAYTLYSLPTWHTATIASTVPTSLNIVPAKTRAEELKFLVPRTYTKGADLKYPADATTIDKIFYLVKNNKKDEHFPADFDFITFLVNTHVHPNFRVFDPYDYNTSTLNKSVISGLVIESLNIDGFSVPMPDLDTTLEEDNSQFLQGALPLRIIKRATRATTGSVWIAEKRTFTPAANQKIGVSLIDISENRLPNFDLQIGNALPTTLAPFDIREHTSWIEFMFTKFGFSSRGPADAKSDPPQIPDGYIIGWSAYRFVSAARVASRSDGIYMLFNERTNYGTNITLSEISHPFRLLPQN